jgi:hypothetical protein
MTKLKLGILGLTSVLAVFAAMIGASSASAALSLDATKCGSEGLVLVCWDEKSGGTNLRTLKGEESFTTQSSAEVEGEEHFLEATLGGEAVKIACAKSESSGTVKQTEPLVKKSLWQKIKSFFQCKVVNPKKCAVEATLKTNSITGEQANATEVLFKPTEGANFITITFKDNGAEKCPATIAGARNVTGEQICLWTDGTVAQATHLLFCPTEDSKLFLGGAENKAIFLEDEVVSISGIAPDVWDIALQ